MNASVKINVLEKFRLKTYETFKGVQYEKLDISYEVFGRKLHTAPIVLVNHALTGNSDVGSPERGWWKDLIGENKVIDTLQYTVVSFNIPGNGYDGVLIDNYKDFIAKDIARIYFLVLQALGVKELYAIIGGSLGGGIAWEMAGLYPNFAKYIIPIAADWKSTDWIIGHNAIQESILLNSKKPLQDARKMAILFYRSPASFTKRFNRTRTETQRSFNVESWLDHHGHKLENRFSLKAYLMMNHLLTTIDVSKDHESIETTLSAIKSKVIQIAVNSDLFFIKEENLKTKKLLDQYKVANVYHEIDSIDGHDAFLIEHEQISNFLRPLFQKTL